MALTYGFYNSVNHDRQYDAIQFGQIFDGIITDGVYGTYLKGMMVIASENANEVIIQPGRAWFNHTWSFNDANLPFEAPQPEVLLDRVDTLVLDVNSEQAERQNKFLWVQGEPSSQIPQPPNLIRSVTHNQYPLCNVYRKAGTTMIYAADITNRVGTSDCPFVTGVLEGIDLDAWINQWDDEFHTWENSTKNNFETWMLSQQTVYTMWFNSIKDQMDTDMDEFEAWFEEIKDIIDESAALHLQAEIDALKAMLPAGSHITVSTVNSELFGRDVTLTDGVHEATARFDQVGFATFESYPYVGLLTITSSDGIQTASTTLNVPYFGRYSCEISFWSATVNIDGDPGLAGYQVMVRDSSDIVVGAVTLDSEGDGVWSATAPDTYKFSVTYGGGTMEVSLNVTQETTYSITLHGGFNYTEWLSAGGVSGTYASLDDVLSDEKAVRQLMTRHAAVDYLASFTSDDASVVTILNNDLAAKWITCTAYAEDVLTDAYSTLMESIGKYGYGKWVLQGQVPKMTSNTTPYGECFGSEVYSSGYDFYKAFDDDDSTSYCSVYDSSTSTNLNKYVGYHFNTPTVIKRCKIKFYNSGSQYAETGPFYIRGSHDGSTWTTLYTGTNTQAGSLENEDYDVTFDNDTAYEYYSLLSQNATDKNASTNKYCVRVRSLQFYAYAPLGNVPIMTGNSAPYGEVVSNYLGTNTYKAFDGNANTNGDASSNIPSGSSGRCGYKFNTPVAVKRVLLYLNSSSATTRTIKIQYSDDGSTWQDAYSGTYTFGNRTYYEIQDTSYHLYWCILETHTGSAWSAFASIIQFYGRQMNVSVPKMDSNTSPYGEAFGSSQQDDYFNAFNQKTGYVDGTYGWLPLNAQDTNPYIAFDFKDRVKAGAFAYVGICSYGFTPAAINGYIEATDDTSGAWTAISSEYTFSGLNTAASAVMKYFQVPISTNKDYRYFRLRFTSNSIITGSKFAAVRNLNFFGFDYSEKEWDTEHPRKYIYDNGVELEEIEQVTAANGWSLSGYTFDGLGVKNPSDLYLPPTSSSHGNGFGVKTAFDFSNYSLLFVRADSSGNTSAGSYSRYRNAIAKNLGNQLGDLMLRSGQDIWAIDVSNVNQAITPAIIGIAVAEIKCYIHEWWLE